jgi:hypothetical protein
MSEYQSVYDRLSPRGKTVLRVLCGILVVTSIGQFLALNIWGIEAANKWYMLVSGVIIGILFVESSLDMFFKYTSDS